jgi:signal transduction histidine kinase/sensor domain CHASE-containing protein
MKLNVRSGLLGIFLRTFLTVLAGLAVWAALSGVLEKRLREEQRVMHISKLTFYGGNVSLVVNTRLALANSLEAFVHTFLDYPDLQSRFSTFAEGLYTGNSGVRVIQVFPPKGSVMQYPVQGNEAVAHRTLKSLLEDPRPNVAVDVARAIETRALALSGPYELNQGGLGLVVRKAIFNAGALWGLAVVVLDLPPLLEQAGVDSADARSLKLAMKDDKGAFFSGSDSVFASDPVEVKVRIQDRDWILAAVPVEGWRSTYMATLRWFRLLGLCIVLLVGILAYVTSYHGVQLRNAVLKATADLRESEGRLKEAQELGKIGNWEFDWASKKIMWSDQVYKLYNRDPELGPPSEAEEAKYYSPETARKIQGFTKLASESGRSVAYDFDVEVPKKGKRFFTAIIGARKNSDGSLEKFYGTVQDITERKRAEMEIESLNVNLESRVATRTAELEEANKDLESFSYSISHDLRSPLRAINGFSHVLADGYADSLDGEGLRLLSRIGDNVEKMGALIDNLLEFSRLGRNTLALTSVDMAAMAVSVFEELTSEEDRKRMDFSVGLLPAAMADSRLIRQVWANLISNAVKFSSEKEKPVIRIEAEAMDGKSWYRVMDNGVGFDMQYADKLFGVFQRLHGQNEFSGTGVGLAIAKKIILRHGGEIQGESRLNEGAVFSFTLATGPQDFQDLQDRLPAP